MDFTLLAQVTEATKLKVLDPSVLLSEPEVIHAQEDPTVITTDNIIAITVAGSNGYATGCLRPSRHPLLAVARDTQVPRVISSCKRSVICRKPGGDPYVRPARVFSVSRRVPGDR